MNAIPTSLALAALLVGSIGTLRADTEMEPYGPNMVRGPGGRMNCSMARHYRGVRLGVPAPYDRMQDPLDATEETIAAGKALFAANCATCHGEEGYGDGPAALGLRPPPPNLRRVMHMRMLARDNYLMWTLSEGGKPVNSAMPAFKDRLSEEQRWQIIHFLRTF